MLISEGFDVVDYETSGLDADVTIITGIDEAYEEIQPAEYHSNGKKICLSLMEPIQPLKIFSNVYTYTSNSNSLFLII